MAKFAFELEVEPREVQGKGASRRLRHKNNLIPAIVYGGEESPQMVCIEQNTLYRALENEAIFSHILSLNVGGKKQKVVIKDIQRHPYRPHVQHVDFMRINENKPITMHVPLHFVGQDVAPGVTKQGGTVTHHMVELEVKCLPRDLPEFIEIDLTNAELDTVVHLSHVKLPKGVELTAVVHGAVDDLPVVSIHLPKMVEEPTEEVPAEEGTPEATAEKPAEGSTGTAKKE